MKAVIMAGGAGTRLRPLTCDRPKPMVPIFERPVMEYVIDSLKAAGIDEIAVTLQYLPGKIINHFEDGKSFGVSLTYFTEDTPLGTAGSVKNAESFLNEDFVVISGDCILDFDLKKAIAYHNEKNAEATILLTHMDRPLEYGVVLEGDDGRVAKLIEKPTWKHVISDSINTGIYICKKEILSRVPKGRPFDFSKDLFPAMLGAYADIFCYEAEGYWCDIGDTESYLKCHFDILKNKSKLFEKIKSNVFVGDDGILVYKSASANIEGGVYLGDDTVVLQNAVVKKGAKISKSILQKGAYIGAKSEVKGALVCENAMLFDGTACFEGAVLGSKSQIGEDSVILPHVRIWPCKLIAPETIVSENIIFGHGIKPKGFIDGAVSGLLTFEISSEYAIKLGSAVKAIASETVIATNGDEELLPLTFALTSGLISAGISSFDMGSVSLSTLSSYIKSERKESGIYLEKKGDKVKITLLSKGGRSINREEERKIENALINGGLNASNPGTFMRLSPSRAVLKHFDLIALRLGSLAGCRAQIKGSGVLKNEASRLLCYLGGAEGEGPALIFDGDEFSFEDENGNSLSAYETDILKALLFLRYFGGPVPLLPSAPACLESYLEGRTRRVKEGEISREEDESLHLFSDKLLTCALFLKALSQEEDIYLLAKDIPQKSLEEREIYCPPPLKAKIMRRLGDLYKKRDESYGGLRFSYPDGGFVMVVPSPSRPSLKIYADALSLEASKELCDGFDKDIKALLEKTD